MSEYSIPIRKYSFYTVHDLAPSGFDIAGRSTMVEKWQHLSSDGRMSLTLTNEGGKVVHLTVANVITKEVYERIDFAQIRLLFSFFQQDPVQFSVKAPSISCKYLFVRDNQILVKRFQLGFYNGMDFVQTSELLQKLGFMVKQAIGTRNSTVLMPSQNYICSQPRTISTAFVEGPKIISNDTLNSKSTMNLKWPTAGNQFALDQGLDFALSQSTPIQLAKPQVIHELSQNKVSQRTPEPKTVDGAGVISETSVCTMESHQKGAIGLNFPNITHEHIKSRLENVEFMKWVCTTSKN